jgi:predicted HicB family RNase H-like nuclease
MLLAHEQDITLNQLVENILREFIERNPVHPNEDPA